MEVKKGLKMGDFTRGGKKVMSVKRKYLSFVKLNT